MFKLKYIPQYFLLLLLLILIFLEAWTYYLGRPSVTFERYMGAAVPAVVQDLGLRRYKAEHTPHLFKIKVESKDEAALIKDLAKRCHMQKIETSQLPESLKKVDQEMVEVIKQSPYIYMTDNFDKKDVTKHRLCVLFRDKDTVYLYLNGDI